MKACWGTLLPLGTFPFTSRQSLPWSQPLTRSGNYAFSALLFWQLSLVWVAFPCSNVDRHIAHGTRAAALQPAHLGNLCFSIYRQHLGNGLSWNSCLKPSRTHYPLFYNFKWKLPAQG